MSRYKTSSPLVNSMPVKWFDLISELNQLNASTGHGFARIWGYIHAEDYDNARRLVDEATDRYMVKIT